MDLRLLLLMVVAGIGFGVLLIHFLGGGLKRSILPDDESVKARFHLDYPEIKIGEICYTDDRRTAFSRCVAHPQGSSIASGTAF